MVRLQAQSTWWVVTLVGLAGIAAHAQEPSQAHAPEGYLAKIDLELLAGILPPPPASGDPRDLVDQDVFQETRKFHDTPRWALAREDADLTVSGLFKAFACTFGPASAAGQPRLAALLSRVASDHFQLFGALKNVYRRKRPFLIHDGPTCVDSTHIAKSFDYPSSHATLGYTTGMILAELDPKQAPAILRRAREYGESRLFCGVHNASAVEAGRTLGSALFALLQGSPAFQKDMAAARLEIKSLAPSRSFACVEAAQTLAASPYSDLH